MARRTRTVLICDRHAGEVDAAGSIEIVVDGERRSLDLCADHLAEVKKALRPWLRTTASKPAAAAAKATSRATSKARATSKGKAKARGAVRPRGKAAATRSRRSTDGAAVRAWAAANGHEIPARGRIPNAVREAYAAAT